MNQITSNPATYTTEKEQNSYTNYPFFSSAIKYGTIAGGLIAFFFFVLQSFGMQDVIGLKYLGYGILGIILAIGLGDYDRFLKTGTTFKNGIPFGARISLFTGVTLIAINTITFLVGSHLVFSKYGMETTDFASLLMLNGAIFFEIMVVGLVFTLIALQYFKSRIDYVG